MAAIVSLSMQVTMIAESAGFRTFCSVFFATPIHHINLHLRTYCSNGAIAAHNSYADAMPANSRLTTFPRAFRGKASTIRSFSGSL